MCKGDTMGEIVGELAERSLEIVSHDSAVVVKLN